MRAFICFCLALTLGACATRAPRSMSAADSARGLALLEQREQQLATYTVFRLTGRIAISDGKDSGSGSFDWDQRGSGYTLNFTAPVTAQNWRLESAPAQAQLIESNGAVRVAANAEELLERELHWRLPAAALRYWVLGTRAPGSDSQTEFAENGELAVLRQNGWEIRYPAFDHTQTAVVPKKLFARSGDHQVRISVRKWSFP